MRFGVHAPLLAPALEAAHAIYTCACLRSNRASARSRRALALAVTASQRCRSKAGCTTCTCIPRVRGGMRAGTIFKRFDAGKLFTLTCQDVAERFHLGLSLLFVVVEEMDNAGSGRPNTALLQRCAAIFAAEVAIDVTKHAVVTKFSDVRPGVYRTFLHVRLGIMSSRTSAAPLTLHAALAAQCCMSGFYSSGQRKWKSQPPVAALPASISSL